MFHYNKILKAQVMGTWHVLCQIGVQAIVVMFGVEVFPNPMFTKRTLFC